jgi:peptidoglycan/LPS O-acetylase OafA/YrhL
MAESNEIKPLTGLRGVAALYVVTFHYLDGLTFSSPGKTFLAHGYLAVDLFFVLSGFVMALSYARMFHTGFSLSTYWKFLGRRLARVYPLYLAATVVALFLVLLRWLPYVSPGSLWITFIANLFMIQTWGIGASLDAPGWSISTEWAAYLLFPLLLIPALYRRALYAWLSGAVALAILAVLCGIPACVAHKASADAVLNLSEPRLALPVWRCLSEFLLGLLAFRIASDTRGLFRTSRGWISNLLVLAALAALTVPRADLFFVFLLPPLIAVLSEGEYLPQRILSSEIAQLGGRLSYSIYLVHVLFTGALGFIHHQVAQLGLPHGQSYAAVVCIVLTLSCAWLAHRYIEVPARQWLRRVLEPRKARRTTQEPVLETK